MWEIVTNNIVPISIGILILFFMLYFVIFGTRKKAGGKDRHRDYDERPLILKSRSKRIERIDTKEEKTKPLEKALPPEDEVASHERVVNPFFSSYSEPQTIHNKNIPLKPDTMYYFTFSIDKEAQLGTIDNHPTTIDLNKTPKEARFKVVLFSFDDGIKLFPNRTVGELRVTQNWDVKVTQRVDSPTHVSSELLANRLFFPVRTPNKTGPALLRCNLYCEQTLIQSRLITARVSMQPEISDAPAITSDLEYSISKTLSPENLSELKELRLSVMLNENSDGSHCFRIFGNGEGKDYVYEKSFGAEDLNSLITDARGALRFASWGTEDAWREGLQLKYQNKLDFDVLTNDLILLAQRGADFYVKLTQKAGPDGDMDALFNLVQKPTSLEFAIKDPTVAAGYMFPAALIYDYPLFTNLDKKEYLLCPSFTHAIKNKIPLESTECFNGDCPSKDNTDYNVICPSGFWGFRHAIGLPLGSKSERIQNLNNSGVPELTAAAYLSFSEWPAHAKVLSTIGNWEFTKTVPETFNHLRDSNPHLVYFFCHGGYLGNKQIIELGEPNEKGISPTDIRPYRINWKNTQPLVFFNGCHTVGMDPGLVLDFASTLVVNCNASGIMGTEITIFQPLAVAFAEEWLTQFIVKGETAGKAIVKARLKLLEQGNPLGLVYTLYASPHLCLNKVTNS